MNILAIGAHFDDIELGCAGAIARHVAQGDQVYVYVATDSGFVNQKKEVVRLGKVAREEAENAMKILGVKELICGKFKTLARGRLANNQVMEVVSGVEGLRDGRVGPLLDALRSAVPGT